MGVELLDAYFKDNSLVRQHLENYKLKLGKVRIDEKPMMMEADGSRRPITPMEARMRDLNYAAPIFLEIIPIVNGVERRGFPEVFIGELPVMIKSKLCHLGGLNREQLVEKGEDPEDPGGYFIINGSERVLVSIED